MWNNLIYGMTIAVIIGYVLFFLFRAIIMRITFGRVAQRHKEDIERAKGNSNLTHEQMQEIIRIRTEIEKKKSKEQRNMDKFTCGL